MKRKYLIMHDNGDITYEENGKTYTDVRGRVDKHGNRVVIPEKETFRSNINKDIDLPVGCEDPGPYMKKR